MIIFYFFLINLNFDLADVFITKMIFSFKTDFLLNSTLNSPFYHYFLHL